MNHIMAVCDGEEPYASKLVHYLNAKDNFPFDVRHFADMEKMQDFSKDRNVDVALVSQEFYEKARQEGFVDRLILLQEKEQEYERNIPGVWKYQSCEKMVKEIMEHLSKDPGKELWINRKTSMKLIGFYSPIKRNLQTSFAFTLGQLLGKKHKVLYINLEGNSGLSRLINRNFHKDMSDLLYSIQNQKTGISFLLGSITEHINGLDILPPMMCQPDLISVTGKEWRTLFEELEKYTEYEYILLDLSDSIQGLFDILRQCTRIYTITGDDGFAMAKADQYEKMLLQCHYEDVLEKTNKCSFPRFTNLPAGLEGMTVSELAGKVKEIIKKDFCKEEVAG